MIYFFAFLDRLIGALMGLTFITVRTWGQDLVPLGSLTWDLHGSRNTFKLSPGPLVPAWAVDVLLSVTGACCSWPGEWYLFTLTLSLWFCSSVTALHLTLVILSRADLHIEFWAWPLTGLTTMSLSDDMGSQMALPVLPWPAQSCLQAKFQDHFYN